MMYEHKEVLHVQYPMLDPYSNKQRIRPNHHDHSKQDLHGLLKHAYNRKTCNGEQRHRLYIINYCSDSTNNSTSDHMRIYIYYYGEQRLLLDTVICNKQNLDPLKRAHTSQRMLLCPNPDPLKHTHSPQGMLLLIDLTGYCVMKRKNGECPDPEVELYHRGVYQRYLGKPVGEMDYVWGDNESMINSPIVPEAEFKLHKRHNILSRHYVRSMTSQGYINMQLVASKWSFSDILTKHWSYQSSYHE